MDSSKVWTILLVIALGLTTACKSPFATDPEIPDHARVTIDGDVAGQLRLVTSNNFQQGREEETGAMKITLLDADTAMVAVPFDDQFPLGRLHRILVRLSNPDSVPVEVHMQIMLGTDKKYDQTVGLDENTVQFAWVYF